MPTFTHVSFSLFIVFVNFHLRNISSGTLVLDSRDRQGSVWLPYNAAKLAAFTVLRCKTSGKTRLVQYVIKANNLFKTSIYALENMLSNFKKPCTTRFSSAGLTALWPYGLSYDPLAIDVWAQFFSKCR